VFTGYVDEIQRDYVAGWAFDTDSPDCSVDVLVFIDGHLHATAPCDAMREDLKALGGYGEGNHGFYCAFPEPLEDSREHRVVVVFKNNGCMVPNGHRLLPTVAARPEFQPVLITAPGRSGTTLLMSRLGLSPDICISDLPPFELRMLSYYATAYRVLTARADPMRSTNPDDIDGDGLFVGFNPFFSDDFEPAFSVKERFLSTFSGVIPDTLGKAFRRIIDEFYATLSKDQGKAGCRYFAEKANNTEPNVRQFARVAFGNVKELVLVRDPRDVYCSQMAYFRRDPDTSFAELSEACTNLIEIEKAALSDTMMVSYEAMLLDQAQTFGRVADFLGADIPMLADPDRESAIFSTHGTSEAPCTSIGRWQAQLTVDQKRRCNDEWGPFLDRFGYSRSETMVLIPPLWSTADVPGNGSAEVGG
jgi:hypothetical protein